MDQDKEEMIYVIGVEPAEDEDISNYTLQELPASIWAVFASNGLLPETITSVWERIGFLPPAVNTTVRRN